MQLSATCVARVSVTCVDTTHYMLVIRIYSANTGSCKLRCCAAHTGLDGTTRRRSSCAHVVMQSSATYVALVTVTCVDTTHNRLVIRIYSANTGSCKLRCCAAHTGLDGATRRRSSFAHEMSQGATTGCSNQPLLIAPHIVSRLMFLSLCVLDNQLITCGTYSAQ